MSNRVSVYLNPITVARQAADYVVEIANRAIATRGRFTLCLSGGRTPRMLYELLGSAEYADAFEWQHTHIFWGDERMVPYDSRENNAHMALEAMLNFVPIPLPQIHRVNTYLPPEEAASAYDALLRDFFEKRAQLTSPRFDLLLLGIGDDGHTASLFPETEALNISDRWVAANFIPKLDTWRVTLTFPAINSAANILFVVTGEEKASVLNEILNGEDRTQYPTQRVEPRNGTIHWVIDQAAGKDLAKS